MEPREVKFNVNNFNNLKDLKNLNLPKASTTIETAERVINGNQMTETCKNAEGKTMKVSIFVDRNGDGKFDPSEAVSVKYTDIFSRSQNTVEYRDTDGDGNCDEVINSDWTGAETVTKAHPDTLYGENQKMYMKYGFKWDTNGPVYAKELPPQQP